MSHDPRSFEPAYFEKLYAERPDPWDFATSDYEQRKYALTLEVLAGRRFRSAFEVGCSIGILTRQLSVRCDWLLAVDVARPALAHAKRHCEGLSQVSIQRMKIPAEWPTGKFDLILFSEVLYFLGPADIASAASRSLGSIMPGGLILLVNWTGETNYPCGGEEAVVHYQAACGNRLISLLQRREPCYRLDLLTTA